MNGRDIFSNQRATCNESVLADPDELLNAHHAFNDDVVLDDRMAGDIDGIGQNDIVANFHIMRKVHVGHDQAVASNPGDHAVRGRLVDGDALTNAGAVSDFHRRWLPVVFQVLRVRPDHRARKKLAVASCFGVPYDGGIGSHPRSPTELDLGSNKGEGLHDDVGIDVDTGMD